MNGFVFKLVASLTKCPCGIVKFTLIFFFRMPDFLAPQQYKMAHVFCLNLGGALWEGIYGKILF